MYKCDLCGREFDPANYKHRGAAAGALNTHKRNCKANHYDKKEEECPGGCEWVFLTGANELEQNAMREGYEKVCQKCDTVQ